MGWTAPVVTIRPTMATPAMKTADQTPASTGSLVDLANFTAQAERQGYRPEITGGSILYCSTGIETGSRIRTQQCIGPDQMREVLFQSQQQRQNAQQREAGNTACNAASC